jgi:UDP-N-acetylmuramate dehydrogenase
MNKFENMQNIQSKISGKILFNEKLSKLSWFNVGGPAKVLFKPENLNELSFFLKEFKKVLPIRVIGVGSNTLIRDGGFDGIIIKFGKAFSHISLFNDNSIIAGASALDRNVANFALDNCLSGFEFLSCIPGSIGGAIRMNSGCYDEEISKILLSVQVIDLEGNIRSIPSSKIKFHYRGSDLDENLIFVSATLKGLQEKQEIIKKKIIKLVDQKKFSQPSNIKTCGSTFKNPKNISDKKAWQLIKLSKCENMQVGDASISKKHCNFFVNSGSAKAKDLENLILNVKRSVFEKTGIELELELQIIGKRL